MPLSGKPDERSPFRSSLSLPGLADATCPLPSFFGAFLVAAIILIAVVHSNDELKIELRMLRGAFLMILLVFLIILNVSVWRTNGVSYTKHFDLETSDRQASQRLVALASILGMMWASFVMAVAHAAQRQWTSVLRFMPLVLWLFIIAFMLNPMRRFYHDTRMWTLGCLWRIVVAPLHRVRFADFWIADQLNSLTLVLLDFEYMVCFLVRVDVMSDAVTSSSSICSSPATNIRQVRFLASFVFLLTLCCLALIPVAVEAAYQTLDN